MGILTAFEDAGSAKILADVSRGFRDTLPLALAPEIRPDAADLELPYVEALRQ